MKLSVIGLGYLGATHAVALTLLGHQVIGVESDLTKLKQLKDGVVPFYEPGLQDAMRKAIGSGNLRFQSKPNEKIRDCAAHFICVGTPQNESDGGVNLSFVMTAGEELAGFIGQDSLVVGKSTVPVGTSLVLREVMTSKAGFDVRLAWNPEFLREGRALRDSLSPDRIVVGSQSDQDASLLKDVYRPILDKGVPCLEMDMATSELVKVAANAFLATKISFVNGMAEIAERTGADIVSLAEALGLDSRIGNSFLQSGLGFGGGCLPKDLRGFMARANELGVESSVTFLREVEAINLRRRQRVIDLAEAELGHIEGRRIVVLGVAFKPESDDLRDSPSLDVALRLHDMGAAVRVHDPMALRPLSERHPEISQRRNLEAAVHGAELIILGTEWGEYLSINPNKFGEMVTNKLIIDGRNVLDVAAWQAAGWRLIALGRNVHN